MARRELQRQTTHTGHRIARLDRTIDRALYDVRTQLAKEEAAVTAILNCANALDALPDSMPNRSKRMCERIAVRTSRLIERTVR